MDRRTRYTLAGFGLLKLCIHIFTSINYNLHRDEYLYLIQGKHLAWGYMEVPPVTAFISRLSYLLGGSVVTIRFFPAIAGAITIVLAGYLVKKLNGSWWALMLTCTGLLVSPALLGTNAMLQPVSFNQLCWFLSAVFLVLAIMEKRSVFWVAFGISVGIGFLTKYSIAFYLMALLVALIIDSDRKWIRLKGPYVAILIATLIFLPNILWQAQHNFPVLKHMKELSDTQLVHTDYGHFITEQFIFHFSSSILWIAGLIGLFTYSAWKKYRFLGLAFFLCVILIAFLHGKPYYTLGAYPILFPFGGIVLDQWIRNRIVRPVLLIALIILPLPALPYAIPVLPIDKMRIYCQWMADHAGLTSRLRWEDGKYYEIPQDFADMFGWEELAQRVANLYQNQTQKEKESSIIIGDSYGHAGALNFYREKYDLPEAISLNGSFMIWAPTELEFDRLILIKEQKQDSTEWFKKIILIDSIHHPFARDNGYIYLVMEPKVGASNAIEAIIRKEKEAFNFN